MSWSDAPIMERLGEFWSWRKPILVPICFTLFERDADKRLLMVVIVAVCSIYMVATWLGYFNLVELYRVPKHYLENHSTQGVLFGASSLFCVLLALQNPKWKSTCLFCLTSSRIYSKYFIDFNWEVWLSISGCNLSDLALSSGQKNQFKARVLSLLIGLGAVCIILATLFINETTRREINTAFTDIETAYTSEQLTSLGIRIVMWSNSLELIQKQTFAGIRGRRVQIRLWRVGRRPR